MSLYRGERAYTTYRLRGNAAKDIKKRCLTIVRDSKMEARRVLYVRHRERELAYSKKYNEEHKEEIKEKANTRVRSAASIEKKKERDREYSIAYKAANFEKVMEYNKTHNNCECGGHYANYHKSTHDKGKKHIKFMEAKA
jgi:hypothetical protein